MGSNIDASSFARFVHARAGRTNKPRPPRNNEQWNVNRLRVLSGLVTLAFSCGGHFMSNDDYALLRTLAARPIAVLLPAIQPRMAVLSAAGYVTRTQDGWIATSTGCSALEAEPGRRSRLHKS